MIGSVEGSGSRIVHHNLNILERFLYVWGYQNFLRLFGILFLCTKVYERRDITQLFEKPAITHNYLRNYVGLGTI